MGRPVFYAQDDGSVEVVKIRIKTLLLLGLWPTITWAGQGDYFECKDETGRTHWSLTPCQKGLKSRRVTDDVAPLRVPLGNSPPPKAKASAVEEKPVTQPTQDVLIRLTERQNGNFIATGAINGVPVTFVIDTGASRISMGPETAARVGLSGQEGRTLMSHTANGTIVTRQVHLSQVTLGEVTVHNLEGMVGPQEMGGGIQALLGMNFLDHFEMTINNAGMTLRLK